MITIETIKELKEGYEAHRNRFLYPSKYDRILKEYTDKEISIMADCYKDIINDLDELMKYWEE